MADWRTVLARLRHCLLHWLHLEPCMNDVERRDGVLWHVVTCVQCGARVLEFPDGG